MTVAAPGRAQQRNGGGFNLNDYVDVADRISEFYTRFPDGRLSRQGDPTVLTIGDRPFILYTALAYRTADDPQPAVGTAWEPFPGRTSFTKDSELMNAETAAWGRAIVAAGIPAKRVASRQEVETRQDNGAPAPQGLGPKARESITSAVTEYIQHGLPGERLEAKLAELGAPDGEGLDGALDVMSREQATVLVGWVRGETAAFLNAKASKP